MIRLHQQPPPTVLVANAATWTAAYSQNNKLRQYAHDDVRDVLRNESHRKCAYCEGRMGYVSASHIDHILPKSLFPDLVCDWNNLILACERCNRNKSNYHSPVCPILNPYEDDPSDHLKWHGPMVKHKSPDRGRVTISRLDLNRAELLYQRAQKMERAKDIIDLIRAVPAPAAMALREELARMSASDAEFSAAVDAYINDELKEEDVAAWLAINSR